MTIAPAIFPVALSLALALVAPRPTTLTPIPPVFHAASVPFMLRQYPDAGYPGDLGFVAIQAYPTAHAAASDTTNNLFWLRHRSVPCRGNRLRLIWAAGDAERVAGIAEQITTVADAPFASCAPT